MTCNESILCRFVHCFKNCVFERIEINKKKNILLEKSNRFICENV